ncbi:MULTISPECIES: hypothetical protein [unclassified Streptomyces]
MYGGPGGTLLRESGYGRWADRVEREILGRNVIPSADRAAEGEAP